MKKFVPFLIAIVFCVAPFTVKAHEHKHGPITISNATVRILLQSRPGAVFMTVHNGGDRADKMISASSPLAKRVEIHTHIMTDGVMKMRPVKGGVSVSAKSDVEFKSGGLHLMVFGLKPVWRSLKRMRLPELQAGMAKPMPGILMVFPRNIILKCGLRIYYTRFMPIQKPMHLLPPIRLQAGCAET